MNLPARSYPGIGQAIILLLILTGFTIAVSLPAAMFYPNKDKLVESFLELLMYTIPFALTIYIGLQRKKESAKGEEGLRFSRMAFPEAVVVFLATLSIGVIIEPVANAIPMPEWFRELMEDIMKLNIISFLLVGVIGPVLEEFLFRGIILDGFLKRYSPGKSILISAILFGLIHFNPWQAIAGISLGVFMGWLYYRTRSLVPCIIVHVANNSTSFLVGMFAGADVEGISELMDTTAYIAVYLLAAVTLLAGIWWLNRN